MVAVIGYLVGNISIHPYEIVNQLSVKKYSAYLLLAVSPLALLLEDPELNSSFQVLLLGSQLEIF